MNYKKILKSQRVRIGLMRILTFIPDRYIVRIQYRIKTNRKLNLKNPKRYTEKLQLYKLFYRNPLMEKCVDKYEVREYIKEKGLEEILIPCFGVFNSVEEINFECLPDQFVLKDTLGGGGLSTIIVTDRSQLNIKKTKTILNRWLKSNYGKHPGREWVYDNKRNRIIAEAYIPSSNNDGGLIEYKFFCFAGKVKYLYGIADRTLGKGAGLGVFNRNFEPLNVERCDEKKLERKLIKPDNFDEMVKIAEKLSQPFPHARIDLYDQNNNIQFGEITFFDGSGYMMFEPDSFDFELGKEFELIACE